MKKRRNYIFTNKKHPEKAIMSVNLGIISIVAMVAVIILTYQKGGEALPGYGVTGLLATIFSIVGLVLGIITVRERESYRLFPWLGLILNLVALVTIGFILYMGIMI